MNLVRTTEEFVCPDGFRMPAYLARPIGDGAYPGILAIYEIFGMSDEMKRVADEIAAMGYAVMMPNLFKRGSWLGCVRRAMQDLAREQGPFVDDLTAARAWLSQRDDVDGSRLVVAGFCMGGGFAMILAKTGLFQVAAPFYGQIPTSLAGSCPMVASFGGKDRAMGPGGHRLQTELDRLDIHADVKIYPDAGHGFMNRAPNPVIGWMAKVSPLHAAYDPIAAGDAMARLESFFAAHL